MAYDRFDTRDERPRWSSERHTETGIGDRGRGIDRDERGFFERAGDEIASWFGDDEAERRRERDHRMEGRGARRTRRIFAQEDLGQRRLRPRPRARAIGRSPATMAAASRGSQLPPDVRRLSGKRIWPPSGDRGDHRPREWRGEEHGESGSSRFDPHYQSWRRRQIDELDRDYDDYRRENQVAVRKRLRQLARAPQAEARPARPDPRAYGSGRQ